MDRVDNYKIIYKEIFKINILHKEETVTIFTDSCYYCKEELGNDSVRDQVHLNYVFSGYVHNKRNLQAKNLFFSLYAYKSYN